jgi:hypothetical protein
MYQQNLRFCDKKRMMMYLLLNDSYRASFAEPHSFNIFSGDANVWPISTATRESISGR